MHTIHAYVTSHKSLISKTNIDSFSDHWKNFGNLVLTATVCNQHILKKRENKDILKCEILTYSGVKQSHTFFLKGCFTTTTKSKYN